MAPTNEIQLNNETGQLGTGLAAATAGQVQVVTDLFSTPPNIPTVADPNYVKIEVNPGTQVYEVLWLVSYVPGSVNGTVIRGAEDATDWPPVAHQILAPWVSGPTAGNFQTMTEDLALSAPLASPALTGDPTAPTNTSPIDGTSELATDAFVQGAVVANTIPAVYYNATGKGAANSELWRMNGDGTNPKQLTSNAAYQTWWAKASPDGTHLAFLRCPVGQTNYDGDYTTQSLWVSDIDGSNQVQIVASSWLGALSAGGASVSVPNWHPNGRDIVFAAGAPGNWQLYLVRADGSNTPQQISITGMSTYVLSDPCISPDGLVVAFVYNYNIWEADILSGIPKQLTTDGVSSLPLHTDPNFSPDGQTIGFLTQTATGGTPNLGQWEIETVNRYAPGTVTALASTQDGNVNSKPRFARDGYVYFHRWQYGTDTNWSLARARADGTGTVQRLSAVSSVRYYQPDVGVPAAPGLDTDWSPLSLLNSWTYYGSPYNTVGYRRIANRIQLKGFLTVTGAASGTVAFQLPPGARPIATLVLPLAPGVLGYTCNCTITTAGNVTINFSSASILGVGLDHLTFLVD